MIWYLVDAVLLNRYPTVIINRYQKNLVRRLDIGHILKNAQAVAKLKRSIMLVAQPFCSLPPFFPNRSGAVLYLAMHDA